MAPVVTGVPGVPGAALPAYAPRRNNASSVGIAPGQQLLPASNRSTVVSNTTARLGIRGGRSKRTRKLRRQYGGASRFLVNIRQILDCAGECKVLDKFNLPTSEVTLSFRYSNGRIASEYLFFYYFFISNNLIYLLHTILKYLIYKLYFLFIFFKVCFFL
jgi:hypothetical protein